VYSWEEVRVLSSTISRRDFLKLLGLGATILGLGGYGGISQLVLNRRPDNKPALAQVGGSGTWSSGQNTTVTAIHAALLPSGKIFYLAGSSYDSARQFGPYEARVLDLSNGSEKNLTQSEDLFCMGQTTLANGNLLFAGGTKMYSGNPNNCSGLWQGLKSAYEFDINSETLIPTTPMRHGRWYPTLVTLADGKVWCCEGYDEYGIPNKIIEVYDPSSKTWALVPDSGSSITYCVGQGLLFCPGAGSPCYNNVCPTLTYYPRAHLMPNGKVVIVGMGAEVYSWDPADGRFFLHGYTMGFRFYGTSILCPLQNTASEKGKILIVGGSSGNTESATAVTSCQIVDFNPSGTPSLRNVSPTVRRRKYPAPVILPDGKILIVGGTESDWTTPIYLPEMFDPVSETWNSNLAQASVPRPYHQVALLLPDGRVWNAGGAPFDNRTQELRTQFYSPGYLFAGPRPTISGTPIVGGYGGSITIPTPDGANITSVSLLRLMNNTHHYDANQRLVWLQVTNVGSGSVTVSAPINPNIAPPGDYMIFILASGVPSIAKIVRIPGSGGGGGDTTPPGQVTGLSATPVSSSQINLSWNANQQADGVVRYNVHRSTTSPFTPSAQNLVAQPTTNSYSNTGLTASTTYYYQVAAVDAAGNIGPASLQVSTTTSAGADSTPPSITITSPSAGSSLPRGTINFLGTSSDNTGGAGVRDVYTSLDGGTYRIATSTNNWSNWSTGYRIQQVGSHTVTARATDKAGNIQLATITFSVIR
jgi:hypothetical protein